MFVNKKILLTILLCFSVACIEVQANSFVTQSLTVGDEIPEVKENITHSITQPDVQLDNNAVVDTPVVETVYYPQVYSPPVYRRQVTRYEFYPNGGMYYGGYGYTGSYSGRGMTVYTNPFGGYNFGGERHYYGPNLNYRPPHPPGGYAPPPPPPNHRPPFHEPGGKPHKPHGGFKGGIMF